MSEMNVIHFYVTLPSYVSKTGFYPYGLQFEDEIYDGSNTIFDLSWIRWFIDYDDIDDPCDRLLDFIEVPVLRPMLRKFV